MKTTIWAARDLDGTLCLFLNKPRLYAGGTFYDKSMLHVNKEFLKNFEWVTHESSPVEMNLSVTKKRHYKSTSSSNCSSSEPCNSSLGGSSE